MASLRTSALSLEYDESGFTGVDGTYENATAIPLRRLSSGQGPCTEGVQYFCGHS